MSEPETGRRRLVGWILLLICLAWVGWFLSTQWEALEARIEVRPTTFGLLVGLSVFAIVVQFYRQLVVLRGCTETPVAFGTWFRIAVLGRVLSLVVPQSGNLYKGVRLKHELGVDYTEYAASLLVFAWLGTLVTLILAAGLLGLRAPGLTIQGLPAPGIVTATMAAVAVAPFLLQRLPVPGRARFGPRFADGLAALQASLSGGLRRSVLAGFVVSSILLFALSVVLVQLAFRVVGLEIGPGAAGLFVAALQIVSLAVLTPGNLGVTEIAGTALGSQLAVGAGPALVACLTLRLASMLALGIVALPAGAREAWGEAPTDPAA